MKEIPDKMSIWGIGVSIKTNIKRETNGDLKIHINIEFSNLYIFV